MSFLSGELRQGIETRRVLDDPVLFAKEILGVELWSKQREILGALWDGQDVDVQSCHSAGKTKVAAVATLGWVARPGGFFVTTAPSWEQGPGTSSDQSEPVRVCTKRDLTQRSTIVPLCLRVTFLLNVVRVSYACTRHHPRSSRRSPRGPRGAGTVQAVVLARRAP